MDKLAERLKEDAEYIDVAVSDELDRRIDASLRAVAVKTEKQAVPRQRPALFWWASSMTGVVAAAIVIVIINSQSHSVGDSDPVSGVDTLPVVPAIDWKAESAMLTQPLRQELEDLQSDLKKAEEKVKQDIGL